VSPCQTLVSLSSNHKPNVAKTQGMLYMLYDKDFSYVKKQWMRSIFECVSIKHGDVKTTHTNKGQKIGYPSMMLYRCTQVSEALACLWMVHTLQIQINKCLP